MFVLQDTLSETQKAGAMELWNAEYPAQLVYHHTGELDEYLSQLENIAHYLHTDTENTIKAWGITFTRENDRWFAMLVHRLEQGKGLGSKLLETLKQNETVLNGWAVDHYNYKKADGVLYNPTLLFYLKNGFTSTGGRLETKKLSAVHVRWTK